MKFSVQADERGIALVRLNGRVIWSAPVNAGVTDFELEAVPARPNGVESIKCAWTEHYVGDRLCMYGPTNEYGEPCLRELPCPVHG